MRPACALILLAVVVLSGCEPSSPLIVNAPLEPIHANLVKINIAYCRFIAANHRPPRGPEDIQPLLAKMGSPDEILRSPRDGQPLVICWGADPRKLLSSAKSTPVLAYERRGVNGSRYVLTAIHSVELMPDAEFRAASFPPGHHSEF